MVAIKLSTRNRNNRFKQHNITVHVDNLLMLNGDGII